MNIVGGFSGYSTDNVDAAKQFYREKLGLSLQEKMGGIGFTLPGGQQIFIYPKENHRPALSTVLNFVVDSIDDSIDELADKGVVFERYDNLPGEQDARGVLRGKDVGMGPNIAWFKDPGGNILALVEA